MGVSSGSGKSEQTSRIWETQSPFLEGLYGAGAQQLGAFQPNQQIASGAMGAWQDQLNAQPQQNPYLNDMTQVFRNQLGQANQQVGGQAGLTGGYGGGRHGVGEAINQRDYAGQVGGFLGNQYQQDQNRAAAQQQGALRQSGNVLGLQPWQQQQSALQQYGQLLGGPTVLGQGSSSSSNFGLGLK